jgi:nicotinate phosphoribosyltransferase
VALLQPAMGGGRRLAALPALAESRALVRSQLDALPVALHSLEPAAPYPVSVSNALDALARQARAGLPAHG